MKIKSFLPHLISGNLLLPAFLFISCDREDEFTIENIDVSGTMNYTTTGLVPLTFDSTGLVPLTARISQGGTGKLSDIGALTMVETFDFDFTTGTGTGFATPYTGTNPADTFTVNGTSQVQLDGTIEVNENIILGTGRFSKISGGGVTIVQLNAPQNAGTGEVDWIVTY